MTAHRWQDDAAFVAAIKARDYLTSDGRVVMSDGIYLYMYELWLDGLAAGRQTSAADATSTKEPR